MLSELFGSVYGLPFGEVLRIAGRLPKRQIGPSGRVPPGEPALENWAEWLEGYNDWAVPADCEDPDDDDQEFHCKKRMLLANCHHEYQRKLDVGDPREQMKRMFAAAAERDLRKFSETQLFRDLGEKVFVLKIYLHAKHTSFKSDWWDRQKDHSDVKVWRLVTCFGDTCLDALHDQIIAPAMGWRRHYHGYKFVAPGSGANFAPPDSDALDMMHVHMEGDYFLDSESYDVRHLLRRKGDHLGYIYDHGDSWCHRILVLDVVEKGTELCPESFAHDKQVQDAILGNPEDQRRWTITDSRLLAGEINCAPEDSSGCHGMGEYFNILKKGRGYVITDIDDLGVNWREHRIWNAYHFDLAAHQKRFNDAVKYRKNPTDGNLRYIQEINPTTARAAPGSLRDEWAVKGFLVGNGSNKSTKNRKLKSDPQSGAQEVVSTKTNKETRSRCAGCGKQKGTTSGLKLFSCSRCQAVSYCGQACQRMHWKEHKKVCAVSQK